MGHYCLSAVGADRPGIVAAVARVLMEQGCNIEDSTMTILGGQFALMLVVATPGDTTVSSLDAALAPAARELRLSTAVTAVPDHVLAASEAEQGEEWTVSVHGADRPGIVHGITAALAGAGANVVDLATRVVGDPGRPAYSMVLTVTVPRAVDGDALASELAETAGSLGVHCTMHPAEADIL